METFFYQVCKIEVVSAEEVLLRRYHDMNYIMSLEYEEGIELMELAAEKEKEDVAWDLYKHIYPMMSEDNYQSFEQFKSAYIVNPLSSTYTSNSYISDEDLLKEVNAINNAAKVVSIDG